MKEEATKDNFLLEIIMYYGVKKKKNIQILILSFPQPPI
jgi:hypothetical protein